MSKNDKIALLLRAAALYKAANLMQYRHLLYCHKAQTSSSCSECARIQTLQDKADEIVQNIK